jgi:hypothetical protein
MTLGFWNILNVSRCFLMTNYSLVLLPNWKAVVELLQRLATRSTPIALQRSQYVVLQK